MRNEIVTPRNKVLRPGRRSGRSQGVTALSDRCRFVVQCRLLFLSILAPRKRDRFQGTAIVWNPQDRW